MLSLERSLQHVSLDLHCFSAAFVISSIMEDVFKSHARKGGGCRQREQARKMIKLETKQASGVAQYLVLISTTSIVAPPKKHVFNKVFKTFRICLRLECFSILWL